MNSPVYSVGQNRRSRQRTTNFANTIESVNLQTDPNKRIKPITSLLWNAFMANMAHPLQGLTKFGLLAIPVLVLNLQPAAAQAPPSDPATQSRPAVAARGGNEASKFSASRHPLDPLQPAEIELAVAAIRKERSLSDSVRFVTVTLKEPSKEVGRQASPAAARPARRS